MKVKQAIYRVLSWRTRHINDRQFIIFLSIVVGVAVGFAAVLIKNLVHFIQTQLEDLTIDKNNYLYFIYPMVGISLVVLFIRYINRRSVGHGIPSVLYAISKNNGLLHQHNLYSSIISSSLTVGFGGSVGLEGPTVATGAAIGSNVGRWLHLSYRQVILLLGCASAGAMAAIFKAPIAAIVFALEVIMLDLTMAALVPLLLSSATAALTSYFFLGQNVLYSFSIQEPFNLNELHFYLIFGVLTGLVCVYFTKIYLLITGLFEKIKRKSHRLFIGGSILGLLVFLLPSLYGEGYEIINQSLHGDYSYLQGSILHELLGESFLGIAILLIIILLMKVVATSVTFGSGGVGGIFAPTLFTGTTTGLLFANIFNRMGFDLSTSNFAFVGMAGLIAGVIHAPLTAIFLIAEITGGYQLFMPLMLVSTISYATVRVFVSNSVYTIQLAKRGELMTHHKDKALLMLMKVEDLIERDFNTISPSDSLGELVKIIAKAHRNIFPVVEEDNTFRGIVKLDDIRNIIFKPEMYDKVHVKDIMFMPEYTVIINENMEEVAQKFQVSGRFNIAVVKEGKYMGFISRAKTFSSYRKILKDFSEH